MNYLDKYTSTLYSPSANLVVPYKDDQHQLGAEQDVTLEVDAYGN